MLTNPPTYFLLLLTTSLSSLSHATPLAPTTLSKRQDIELRDGGTITGNLDDSLTTFGLATCPGIAAIGVAPCGGCVSKILTHVLCGLQWQTYLNGFITAYNQAGLLSPSIALAVANPDLTAAPDAQRDINMGCFRAAAALLPANEAWKILHVERQSISGGEDQGRGTLKVTAGTPAIIAEGDTTMNPNPPQPAACSWPVRYLRSDATNNDLQLGIAQANQICVDYFEGNGIPCRAPNVAGCDLGASFVGQCRCFELGQAAKSNSTSLAG